jgi:hypothetical protein
VPQPATPEGRDYGGAIFSAGVSGLDGKRIAPRVAAATLGALFRVSDDSGLPDTLGAWELNRSGRAFIPFFGATLLPQADGRIGSDIFTRNVR